MADLYVPSGVHLAAAVARLRLAADELLALVETLNSSSDDELRQASASAADGASVNALVEARSGLARLDDALSEAHGRVAAASRAAEGARL